MEKRQRNKEYQGFVDQCEGLAETETDGWSERDFGAVSPIVGERKSTRRTARKRKVRLRAGLS